MYSFLLPLFYSNLNWHADGRCLLNVYFGSKLQKFLCIFLTFFGKGIRNFRSTNLLPHHLHWRLHHSWPHQIDAAFENSKALLCLPNTNITESPKCVQLCHLWKSFSTVKILYPVGLASLKSVLFNIICCCHRYHNDDAVCATMLIQEYNLAMKKPVIKRAKCSFHLCEQAAVE